MTKRLPANILQTCQQFADMNTGLWQKPLQADNYLLGQYREYEDIPKHVLEDSEYSKEYSIDYNADTNVAETLEEGITHPTRFSLLESQLSEDKKTTVLEYGGSLGQSWQYFKNDYNLEYYNTEVKTTVDLANNFYKMNNFFDHVPSIDEVPQIDLIYSRSSIHYDPEWKTVLKNFAELSPRMIIFQYLTADRGIEDFWTIQCCRGNACQWHFFNFEDFNSRMEQFGYKLVCSKDVPYDFEKLFRQWPQDKKFRPDKHMDLTYEL